MGDHIVLNGLVRHIYKREKHSCDKFYLLCYEHNAANVRAMYADLPKLDLLLIKTDSEIVPAIESFDGRKEDLHLDQDGYALYDKIGDEAFFISKGYPVSLLTKFKAPRNKQKEAELKQQLTGGDPNYIFVHDDAERGYPIDETKLPQGYKIVRAPKEIPMFELLGLIEDAKERHVISSSFLCICIAMKLPNTTAHLYIRNGYLKNYLEKLKISVLI